jgi:hypothetical protein
MLVLLTVSRKLAHMVFRVRRLFATAIMNATKEPTAAASVGVQMPE